MAQVNVTADTIVPAGKILLACVPINLKYSRVDDMFPSGLSGRLDQAIYSARINHLNTVLAQKRRLWNIINIVTKILVVTPLLVLAILQIAQTAYFNTDTFILVVFISFFAIFTIPIAYLVSTHVFPVVSLECLTSFEY
ncbi:hypothetical protein BDR26DRAFT_863136 [Obelidium mucronatum]|nr:hypothetical protein BDR26DRAFT_863136 [Obelidium mucronatum]